MLISFSQIIITFNSQPSLAFNKIPVKQVAHTKLLGMQIDEHMSRSVHIDDLCKKVASSINVLKRIRHMIANTLQMIYS